MRRFKQITSATLLCVSALCVPAIAQEGRAKLPTLAELKDGWNTLTPRGRTSCAVDPDYRFFVRRAATERLLIYFEGGGACWDGATCDPDRPDATYRREVGVQPAMRGGIFDLVHPENPFTSYSMVVVPYCTGDVHLGDRDTAYTAETAGTVRSLAIKHRGLVNGMSALRWVFANFPAAREVFVTGTSAGAVATPFYASLLARQYPQARVIALGDAAGAYRGSGSVDRGRWGLPEVLRRHPGWEQYDAAAGLPSLYFTAARAAPQVRLYQFDNAHDQVQLRYRFLGGNREQTIFDVLRANRRDISVAVPGFRWFTAGGPLHGVMGDELFYSYRAANYRLRDWVAALARGDTVANVECTACERPELVFTQADIRLLSRAIEMLSAPGKWRAQDSPGACANQSTDRYSLRCALVIAHRDLTGKTVRGTQNLPAGFLEVLFTVAARLNDPMLRREPLREFNNRPGATAENMVALLQEVRNRISASRPRGLPHPKMSTSGLVAVEQVENVR